MFRVFIQILLIVNLSLKETLMIFLLCVDKLGWLNWFWQFFCEGLSSFNWWKSWFLNLITSVLLNLLCVCLFNFLYLEKLKSTCKHEPHCSHHSPSNVVWSFFCFSNENTLALKNRKEINCNYLFQWGN